MWFSVQYWLWQRYLIEDPNLELDWALISAGTGSKFSGSGFEIGFRVGLGFHKLVSEASEILFKPLVKVKSMLN